MPAYTVLEPPPHRRSIDLRTDRVRFLRESFSFWAFLFGPLWMIWRRQWLVLILYVLVVGGAEFAMRQYGIPLSSRIAVYVLVQILIGTEAGGLRRWTLQRHGWRDVGIVVGDDLEMAERRFFDARLMDPVGVADPLHAARRGFPGPMEPPDLPGTIVPPVPRSSWPGPEVTGLFPEPGSGATPKSAS